MTILILLPGLMCDQTVWSEQVRALGPERCIALDGYPFLSSIEAMADLVLAKAPEQFALAGHSMGARVAIEVIRKAPERVLKLALLDTGVHPVRAGEAEKRYALLELGRREGIDAMLDQWMPPMVHPDRRQDKAFMDTMRAMCRRAGLDSYERQITALLNRPAAIPVLDAIRCPTLIGVGRQDEWSPVAQHEDIARHVSGSTLSIFEDAGHMAPMEQPDQVSAALKHWLDG